MADIEITMLTNMANADNFCLALDRFNELELRLLDIKDQVWGKPVIELTNGEAERAAREIKKRSLETYCLSSMLFHQAIESGEAGFRRQADLDVDRLINLANVFEPEYIRLLSARTDRRAEIDNSIVYIEDKFPWLIECYREAIQKIDDSGFKATIENEARLDIFSTTQEVADFFELLDMESARFTWDIQNLWAMGTFPSMEVYEQLRSNIGFIHFKGGQVLSGGDGDKLYWRSPLDVASWPVKEICAAIIKDRSSPVVCINPSHGQIPEDGYDRDLEMQRDCRYLKAIFRGNSQ
jgi:sugar phosphate isomerase/epimerase